MKNKVETILRVFVMMLGVFVVFSCVKFATDRRANMYEIDKAPLNVSARTVEKQLQCLAYNIYWEAASEPFEGKVAVAQVTINRMQSGRFPDTVCGVVHQKTTLYDKVVCQFSWLCETNYKTKAVHKKMFEESEEVAKMVLLEGFRLVTLKDAIYYHADYVNPRWNKERITKIGRHIFYKDKTT